MRGKESYEMGEFGRRNFSQSDGLVPNLFFEKINTVNLGLQ